MKTVSLALRNLTRSKRRNAVLAIAIAFGFFVVTTINGLVNGMGDNFENLFAQLYGGNVIIEGLEWRDAQTSDGEAKTIHVTRDKEYIKNIIDELKIDYDYSSIYTYADGQIVFNGKKANLRIFGRDLNDKDLKDSFKFVSGGIDNSVPNALIISDKTAETLNIEVGDEVILTTSNVLGQNTFGDMVVTGILKSNGIVNTIFAYADIEGLNKIVEMPEGGYVVYAVHIPNKNKQDEIAHLVEQRIRQDSESNPMINVTDRALAIKTNPNDVHKGLKKQTDPKKPENAWQGTKYRVETVDDEQPGLKNILFYVNMISTIILVVILLIVCVGISNTYRMVLMERIREIGTMRAIGMPGKDTKRMFSQEAIILSLIGATAGLVSSVILMTVFHFIPFNNDALSFFLKNGHFTFKLQLIPTVIQFVILIVLTALAVRGSAKKAAKMSPAAALRSVR
ncbi:MAG: ABC transporter permease [Treponema sp.]|nr:ABC transporter permease [Treponema sp.]